MEAAVMRSIAGADGGADRACTGMRQQRAVGRQRRPAAAKVFVVCAKRKYHTYARSRENLYTIYTFYTAKVAVSGEMEWAA